MSMFFLLVYTAAVDARFPAPVEVDKTLVNNGIFDVSTDFMGI